MRGLENILTLSRRRWCLPVMAELERRKGAKFVTLCHRLEGNQAAVRQSLDHLMEIGWVERNPGYGHPLRPEYILTRKAARVAPVCAAVDDALTALHLRAADLRRWSLPSLRVIAAGEERFSAIANALAPVTDRALTLSLKDLTGERLLVRTVFDETPARVEYGVHARAKELAGHLLAV